MPKMIRLTIHREDSLGGGEAQTSEFAVEADGELTVLEALQRVYQEKDPTLAYRRYRCGRRLCGSCEVKLDGRVVRGCATLLTPGESYRLEPARPASLVRDLVFTFVAGHPGEGEAPE